MSRRHDADAIERARGVRRHLAGDHIAENALRIARERAAESCARRRLDADRVAGRDRQIREVGGQLLLVRSRRIHQEAAGPALAAAIEARRADDLTQAAPDEAAVL